MLVNDIWGAEILKGGPAQWNTPIWDHDLDARIPSSRRVAAAVGPSRRGGGQQRSAP